MLRTPEITVSTSVGSDTSWGGCGHGHAMAGGERFSGKVVGLAREGGGARGEGNRVEGSPRFFWCCWRGRGGTGSGESTEGSFGGRRRNGDGDGVAGLPEGRGSVGRKEGVEAELPGASVRRGEHGGCGNRRRWRRLRSGPRCGARGRGEGETKGTSEGVQGFEAAPRRKPEASRWRGTQAGREVACRHGAHVRCLPPLPTGRGRGRLAPGQWAGLSTGPAR